MVVAGVLLSIGVTLPRPSFEMLGGRWAARSESARVRKLTIDVAHCHCIVQNGSRVSAEGLLLLWCHRKRGMLLRCRCSGCSVFSQTLVSQSPKLNVYSSGPRAMCGEVQPRS